MQGGVLFTEVGRAKVKFMWVADAPELFFQQRDIPIEDYSTWELVDALLKDGWLLHEWAGRRPAPLVLDEGLDPQAKRICFHRSQGSFKRPYLECLARHAELRQQGVREIGHGLAVGYYTALLRQGPVQLVDDIAPTDAGEALEDQPRPEAAGEYEEEDRQLEDEMLEALAEALGVESSAEGPDADAGSAPAPATLADPAAAAPPVPGGSAVAAAAASSGGDFFFWGDFKFKLVHRGDRNQVQCTCPFHGDPGDADGTTCRKTMKWESLEEGGRGLDFTLRVLKRWCLDGRICSTRRTGDRQSAHFWVPLVSDPPTMAALDAELEAGDPGNNGPGSGSSESSSNSSSSDSEL